MVVAFDLDDTLYKERDFVASGLRSVAREASRTGLLSYQECLAFIESAPTVAGGFVLLAEKLHRLNPNKAIDVNRMLDVYRYHYPSLSPGAGVVEALTILKEEGCRLGVITDGRNISQRNKLKALGLENFFEPVAILISEQTGGDKTNPLMFERVMRLYPNERQFAYVGDNPQKDFLWPNRLKWLTVQLDDVRGQNVHSQSVEGLDWEYLAQHHVSSLSGLPDFLRVAAT